MSTSAKSGIDALRERMAGFINRQTEVIDRLLIEDLRGLAKKRAVKALTKNMDARFSRN